MQATYIIPECNLSDLLSTVEKLNKRAKRLGVPEVVVTSKVSCVKHQVRQITTTGSTNLCWRESIEKRSTEDVGDAFLANAFEVTGLVMAWHEVTITGESPCLNGWEIVAVLEPLVTEEGTTINLMRTIPGCVCPSEYRSCTGVCDHCNTSRRRKETFVVRNESGEHKSVGRQCLKDFLGYHADPHALAQFAEMIAQLNTLCENAGEFDEEGYGRCGEKCWDLHKLLTVTATRIRLFGWKSRTVARERGDNDATADTVIVLLTPPDYRNMSAEKARLDREYRDAHVEIVEDSVTAEDAITWAKSFTETQTEENEYLANCNTVSRVGFVTRGTVGVAVSIVSSFLREKDRLTQMAAKSISNHVGTVGVRIDMLKVTCEKVMMSEGQYGVTGIHRMHDEAGNDLVWFASGGEVIKAGETVTIAASVKSHGEYKGRKQTTLTRCVVWTAEGLAEAIKKQERKAVREAKKKVK